MAYISPCFCLRFPVCLVVVLLWLRVATVWMGANRLVILVLYRSKSSIVKKYLDIDGRHV